MKVIILVIVVSVILFITYLFIVPRILVYRLKRRIKKAREDYLTDISNDGFTIFSNQIPRTVNWKEIVDLHFLPDDSIQILLKDESKMDIKPDCIGRLEFMKKVPKGMNGFDYKYVD